jgi:hypothetical protein
MLKCCWGVVQGGGRGGESRRARCWAGSRVEKRKPEKEKEKMKKFHVRMERRRLIRHMRILIMRTEYVMAMERQG